MLCDLMERRHRRLHVAIQNICDPCPSIWRDCLRSSHRHTHRAMCTWHSSGWASWTGFAWIAWMDGLHGLQHATGTIEVCHNTSSQYFDCEPWLAVDICAVRNAVVHLCSRRVVSGNSWSALSLAQSWLTAGFLDLER
eukprot:gene21906-biopygen22203